MKKIMAVLELKQSVTAEKMRSFAEKEIERLKKIISNPIKTYVFAIL